MQIISVSQPFIPVVAVAALRRDADGTNVAAAAWCLTICVEDLVEQIANWVAPLSTTLAAVLVAANLGARITGIGFIAFAIGSVAWMIIGGATGQANLVWQNAVLLGVNLLGVWRWLCLRARYDKGAAAATRATARR